MRNYLILICLFWTYMVKGQADTLSIQIDSLQTTSSDTTILELEDFLAIVLENHPVVKQAEITRQSGDANLLTARGGFDPKVSIDYDLKNFKEKEYWDIFNSTLKVPTVLGIEPKISIDRAEGEFLNTERSIPSENQNTQVSTGLTIPVGKGMFIDERRATLKQAKLYQNIAQADQNKMINDILLKATKDYWNWTLAYKELDFLAFSIEIAQEIFRRVNLDYEFGEASVVDTVQAKIALQTREADYVSILYQYIEARINLTNHLWSPEGLPLELQETTIPDTLAYSLEIPSEDQLNSLLSWASTNHPEIQKTINKIGQLEVENRLNKEMLKPQADLTYSFIDAPFSYGEEANSFSFDDNYKLGVAFSFPLLLRKERGKIQKTNLKIESNNFELQNKKLKIQNSILTKFAQIQTAQTLTYQYEDIRESYEQLLEAESFNFELGESDLFKLNIQIDKFIESQIKYLENLIKLQKNKVELLYESGSLYREYN